MVCKIVANVLSCESSMKLPKFTNETSTITECLTQFRISRIQFQQYIEQNLQFISVNPAKKIYITNGQKEMDFHASELFDGNMKNIH